MAAPILIRTKRKKRDNPVHTEPTLAPGITFERARLHEVCGNARHNLAMQIAAMIPGPILWITPAWQQKHLLGDAMRRFTDPGRFLFIHPEHPIDLLWSMEEALRSGACPLVVADLPEPTTLTPTRRLLLAAETGAAEGAHRPLGLILTPGTGGSRGVESRWSAVAAHGPEDRQIAWELTRLYARSAPPASWRMIKEGKALRYHKVASDGVSATQK